MTFLKTVSLSLFLIILLISIIVFSQANSLKNAPTSVLSKVDRVLIKKKERLLVLMRQDKKIKQYKISLGFDPVGPKTKKGDGKTPEGLYRITTKNAHSQFHRSLGISYPNSDDLKRGCTGSDIMIHGLKDGFSWLGAFHTFKDWTRGCIAVTNEEIEEIWQHISVNTLVEILP